MGGSYSHIVNGDNQFIGIVLIDNLGDAHEALEECYNMINYLTKGDKRKIYEAWNAIGGNNRLTFEEYWTHYDDEFLLEED